MLLTEKAFFQYTKNTKATQNICRVSFNIVIVFEGIIAIVEV